MGMRRSSPMLIAAVFCCCAFACFGQVTAVSGDPIPGVAGYGVNLGLDTAGNVAALLVYKGTNVSQELVSCTSQAVPRDGNVGTMASADLNFDGFGDLLLQVSSKDKNATYCVWLFDPRTQKYVASPELSQLVNLAADPKTQTVTSNVGTGCFGSCYHNQTYKWEHGTLTLVRDESITGNITAPSSASQGCAYVKSVKVMKKGKLTEVSRDTVNSMGVICAP